MDTILPRRTSSRADVGHRLLISVPMVVEKTFADKSPEWVLALAHMAAPAKFTKRNKLDYVSVPQIVIRRLRPVYWAREQKLKALMQCLNTSEPGVSLSQMPRKDRVVLMDWLARYVVDVLLPEFDADEFYLVFKKIQALMLDHRIRRADSDGMLASLCESRLIMVIKPANSTSAAVYGYWRRRRCSPAPTR